MNGIMKFNTVYSISIEKLILDSNVEKREADFMFFLQMSGFPGSVKSILFRHLSKLTGAVIIDHDIVKSSLLKSLESNNIVADTIMPLLKASHFLEGSSSYRTLASYAEEVDKRNA
jgi:hypothetical protein